MDLDISVSGLFLLVNSSGLFFVLISFLSNFIIFSSVVLITSVLSIESFTGLTFKSSILSAPCLGILSFELLTRLLLAVAPCFDNILEPSPTPLFFINPSFLLSSWSTALIFTSPFSIASPSFFVKTGNLLANSSAPMLPIPSKTFDKPSSAMTSPMAFNVALVPDSLLSMPSLTLLKASATVIIYSEEPPVASPIAVLPIIPPHEVFPSESCPVTIFFAVSALAFNAESIS